jgi:L,D-transpeptidase catalytic domain
LPKFAWSLPLPADGRGRGALHRVLVSGAASALLVGLAASADAAPRGGFFSPYGWYGGGYYSYPAQVPSRRLRAAPTRREAAPTRRESAEPKKEVGFGEMPKGPLQIVVSIDHQRVTLFSNGVRVAQGPVSTGVPGHPTPMGVFSIIEKDRYHHSNLYSNAPMPFMQRITWSGVALHEGVLPGYPASHGCIRMSRDFAQKLWPTTQLGARVIVARGELAPVDFEHPKLFVPKPKPAEPEVAANTTTDGYRAAPITLAQAATPDAREGGATATPAEVAPATAQPGASDSVPAGSDIIRPAPTIDPAKPITPRLRAAEQPVKRSGQVAVFVSRKEMKIFVRQGFVPLFDMPVVIDEPDRPLGTHVLTAMAVTDNGMRWNLMTIPTDSSAPVDQRDYNRKRSKEPSRPAMQLKPSSTAAEALDRIAMPKEAVERISELLIPGSSLVIADEGLGRETGRYTEFIVLSH